MVHVFLHFNTFDMNEDEQRKNGTYQSKNN